MKVIIIQNGVGSVDKLVWDNLIAHITIDSHISVH